MGRWSMSDARFLLRNANKKSPPLEFHSTDSTHIPRIEDGVLAIKSIGKKPDLLYTYIYIDNHWYIYIGFPGPAIKCLRHPAFGMPHSKWQTYSSLCSNYPNQSSSKLFYEPHELQRSTQRLPRTWSLFSFIQITVRVWVMLRVRVFPCFSGSRATNQTVLH